MAKQGCGDWINFRQLGEGGQAHTFLVNRRGDGSRETHVLKRLKNPKRFDRFDREAAALRRVESEHVPRLIDFRRCGDRWCIVSEYDGGSMKGFGYQKTGTMTVSSKAGTWRLTPCCTDCSDSHESALASAAEGEWRWRTSRRKLSRRRDHLIPGSLKFDRLWSHSNLGYFGGNGPGSWSPRPILGSGTFEMDPFEPGGGPLSDTGWAKNAAPCEPPGPGCVSVGEEVEWSEVVLRDYRKGFPVFKTRLVWISERTCHYECLELGPPWQNPFGSPSPDGSQPASGSGQPQQSQSTGAAAPESSAAKGVQDVGRAEEPPSRSGLSPEVSGAVNVPGSQRVSGTAARQQGGRARRSDGWYSGLLGSGEGGSGEGQSMEVYGFSVVHHGSVWLSNGGNGGNGGDGNGEGGDPPGWWSKIVRKLARATTKVVYGSSEWHWDELQALWQMERDNRFPWLRRTNIASGLHHAFLSRPTAWLEGLDLYEIGKNPFGRWALTKLRDSALKKSGEFQFKTNDYFLQKGLEIAGFENFSIDEGYIKPYETKTKLKADLSDGFYFALLGFGDLSEVGQVTFSQTVAFNDYFGLSFASGLKLGFDQNKPFYIDYNSPAEALSDYGLDIRGDFKLKGSATTTLGLGAQWGWGSISAFVEGAQPFEGSSLTNGTFRPGVSFGFRVLPHLIVRTSVKFNKGNPVGFATFELPW